MNQKAFRNSDSITSLVLTRAVNTRGNRLGMRKIAIFDQYAAVSRNEP